MSSHSTTKPNEPTSLLPFLFSFKYLDSSVYFSSSGRKTLSFMDGLIPMVFKAIKKNKIRRQYECLSSGAAQSHNTADFNSNIVGHQNSTYAMHSGEKMEQRQGHRRHKSVGDFYVGYSSANGGGFRGGGGGSPPPRAKQLVRFRSHRMFSCVSGAS